MSKLLKVNDTIPTESYFPDDVWKLILQFCSIETWPNLLASCKKLYQLGLTTFLNKIQMIAKFTKEDEITDEDARIKSLFKFENLYQLIENGVSTAITLANCVGVEDTVVVTSDTIGSVPWMEADGVTVAFPLIESYVAPLLAKSEVTPFGKGGSTLVDTSKQRRIEIVLKF